ncbi:MAG TPA: CDP-diacylglycerol--serine O-phosphatidyltransferase [Alphaproteobacteria bacterium]|nr:CDP-diacylglycerol--serine O-phosphatidyltransferase [Alphaproteobacteria bacterium]
MLAPSPRHRLKDFSLNKLIPNILTVLALCAGLTAIRFGLQQRFEPAVIAIMLAGIFDALDGRIARMLGGSTKFGAEMDSLSDVVSFGVAPSMVLYQWTMRSAGSIGWALVLIFSVCCALRLARFNTKLGAGDLPPWAYRFFTGVPAPAGAGLVLTPMMITFDLGPGGIFGTAFVNGIIIVAVSMLMVSQIPTYSGKSIRIPQRYVLPLLLLVGLFAAFLVAAPWSTLPFIALVYVASIPLSLLEFRRLARQTRAATRAGDETR